VAYILSLMLQTASESLCIYFSSYTIKKWSTYLRVMDREFPLGDVLLWH
jgi:hypothetical protein